MYNVGKRVHGKLCISLRLKQDVFAMWDVARLEFGGGGVGGAKKGSSSKQAAGLAFEAAQFLSI